MRVPLLLALLACAVALYFVDLDGSSIWDANEAFYVETPREMIERGDYVSPTFNYEPRLNKPVLSYWIVAGFYHLFGVSVGAQRLAIALGALVMIAAAFFLARAAAPGRLEAGTAASPVGLAGHSSVAVTAGLWAALGLAISPRLVMFGRRIFIDIYVSMFMALTLLFFALSERHPQRRRLFLALMYVAAGFGVLTKGPVAAVLPALAFGIYLLVHGEWRRVREMMIPAGVLIVCAIVIPWYAALYQRDGWTYIAAFVFGENLARYTEGLGVHATRGPFFYLPVVFSDAFPLSIFLLVAGAAWVVDWRGPHAARDAGFRVRTLLWLWIATVVAFFSMSAAKQDLYIFPIVPAIAALGGVAIARGTERSPFARAIRICVALLGAVLVLFGAAFVYLFGGAGSVYALDGTLLAGSIGVAGGLIALALAVRPTASAGLVALAATLIAVNWAFVVRVLPSFEVYKPVPAFARTLNERIASDDLVATYNVALPSLVYYLQRRVEMAYDPEPIRHFLASPRTVYVILPRTDYAAIRDAVAAPTCIVSTQPTFDVKLRNIIARDPLPDLLLISNRCR